MADEDDNDKQFEPSQKKLDDARKKGEIVKSNDLITAGAYAGFILCAATFGPQLFMSFGQNMTVLLDRPDEIAAQAFRSSQTIFMGRVIWSAVEANFAWFAFPIVAAILVIFAQRAFVFAPTKLEPKLSRISPIEGAKNKFGRQGLFEFLKSGSKLILYCIVLGVFLRAEMDRIVASVQLSASMVAVEFASRTLVLLLIVLLIALGLGAIDYLWQSAQHIRKHRMSRKEMMDELKQSEGDPMMKQQRRQKGMDLATNRMLEDVPKADVIIVNPEHYAIALEWSRLPGDAPVCIAKGLDEIAAKIREIAAECDIPIHSDPPTARAIHASVELGEQILPEHYKPVAAAIRFAEEIRQKAGKS